MAVPDFQAVMRPLLTVLSDGKIHALQELIATLADTFGLTAEERSELLPSGFQAKFTNRVAWSSTHLQKAGVIERVSRGKYRLTQRGVDLLAANQAPVTTAMLERFPEYIEFKSGTGAKTTSPSAVPFVSSSSTPAEEMDAAAQVLRRSLAIDVLDRVKRSTPVFFEILVVDLLVRMGYGGSRADAGKAVGRSGDGGIDGIIKEDRLGLDAVYIQAKKWEKPVGRPEVQMFAGSLDGQKASKGVMLTTSAFTGEARSYATSIGKRIVLIDGVELAELMIDTGVGVTTVVTYDVKKVDEDYFEPA